MSYCPMCAEYERKIASLESGLAAEREKVAALEAEVTGLSERLQACLGGEAVDKAAIRLMEAEIQLLRGIIERQRLRCTRYKSLVKSQAAGIKEARVRLAHVCYERREERRKVTRLEVEVARLRAELDEVGTAVIVLLNPETQESLSRAHDALSAFAERTATRRDNAATGGGEG